jgi:solute carrier family 35 protein F5
MSVSKKVLGFCLLFLVICLWVASSTAIQLLFTSGGFQKPFFLTYFSTSMFMLYLLKLPFKQVSMEEFLRTARQAVQFCPLWFGANYFFNLSLSMTSLSSNTIISSSSGVLTLVLAIFILEDSPDILKFAAALLALGGVAMVAANDQGSSSESAIGDLLALCGALMYASYSVFLKARTEHLDIVLFFGCVGASNVILFMGGFFILNYTGFEPFELPSSVDWAVLCVNGLLGTVVSDMLWALSVRFLNPALCTIGITLTIPLAFLVQAMLFSFELTLLSLFGGVCVVCGFIVMCTFEHPTWKDYVSNAGLKALICRGGEVKGKDQTLLSGSQARLA